MAKEATIPNGLPDLNRLPWDDLYPRLLLAALGKIGRRVWRGQFRGQPPGGRTAHDAVQTAVEKFLAGERQWNPDKSAYENLWGAISSEISNWVTSTDNRTTRPIDDDKVVQLLGNQPTPEHDAEWRSERDQFLRYLDARNDEAARMAKLMLDHDLQGLELAKAMGQSQRGIDNIKKRLKRLTQHYLADRDHPGAAE